MSTIVEKIEHVWSLICSYSVTDSDSNNMSVFNLIETLHVPLDKLNKKEGEAFSVPFNFQLVTRLRKKETDEEVSLTLKASIIDPSGNLMGEEFENQFEFPKQLKNIRIRTLFESLPVKDEGLYYIKIKIKGADEEEYVDIARVPLEIVFKNGK